MRRFVLYNLLLLLTIASFGQTNDVKNVILMITDGTSTSLLSAARWYKTYHDPSQNYLYLDAFVTGLTRTCSSDAPIGDSAPTTSCYMTGYPTQTGFVSTYPVKTDHDLFPVDAARAYQPLATLMEAAKQMQGKSTGLVVTCEFPHATPADCAAHSYDRGKYGIIAPQVVHNMVDVVISGGTEYVRESDKDFLKENGYSLYFDDFEGMKKCQKAPMWALFGKHSMPYDMERDPKTTPSLAEMTQKALDLLSADPDGFFLMIEGSKVDWAAHDNDAKGAITEFLAFDEAFHVAQQFAEKDGHTLIVVLPDHGNSALTIGNTKSNHGYDRLSLQQIMEPLDSYTITTTTMAKKMKKVETSEWPGLFREFFGIELQDAETEYLQSARDYDKSTISKEERKNNLSLVKMLSQVIYGRTYFGFTTFGHTAEDVFTAMYHPQGKELRGINTNIQLNHYIREQMGLSANALEELTDDNYADHREVFEGLEYKIDSLAPYQYRLTVKNKKKTLVVESFTNYVIQNKQKSELNSVIIYFLINKTFYLPKSLRIWLELKN